MRSTRFWLLCFTGCLAPTFHALLDADLATERSAERPSEAGDGALDEGYRRCGMPEMPIEPEPKDSQQKLDHVHVALAADPPNFAGILTAMISLTTHLVAPGRCTIHLITMEQDMEQAEVLVGCFQADFKDRYSQTEHPVPAVEVHPFREAALPLQLQMYGTLHWVPVFLHVLLPQVPRVIYLDHDVIVETDLEHLYTKKMSHALAAAPQYNVWKTANQFGTLRDMFLWCQEEMSPEWIGVGGHALSFNSGVLLLDLQRLRSSDIITEIVGFTAAFHGCLVDQLSLNLVFQYGWDRLDAWWNVNINTSFHLPRCMTRKARIFHFGGVPKYWMQGHTSHPSDFVWQPYRSRLRCAAENWGLQDSHRRRDWSLRNAQ